MTEFLPLVAVVGSTGVGKSRLSIELASAVRDGLVPTARSWKGSKIINADAMQAYKGLDLVTNKISKHEMNGIEHALFDFRELHEEYIVTDWVANAIFEIDAAHATNQLPVVVGGTTYWLQHLLFTNRLTSLEDAMNGSPFPSQVTDTTSVPDLPSSLRRLFDNLPPRGDDVDETTAFNLHALLSYLDPATAARWHWKDSRKVLRSLNIIKESNTTVRDAYGAQPDPLARFPTIIFWLYMSPADLNPMLDSRVDKMVQLGLREEVEYMRSIVPGVDSKIQMAGLNQAIGYKEFDAYLKDPNRPQVEFDRGVEQMKLATRQYATRQIKWLKARLLPAILASRDTHIVLLELKDPTTWSETILKPSIECLRDFLNGFKPSKTEPPELLQSFMREIGSAPPTNERRKVTCDVCTTDPRKPVMLDEKLEWDKHKKSRAHRRKENRDSRKEQQMSKRDEVRLQRASLRDGLEFEDVLLA